MRIAEKKNLKQINLEMLKNVAGSTGRVEERFWDARDGVQLTRPEKTMGAKRRTENRKRKLVRLLEEAAAPPPASLKIGVLPLAQETNKIRKEEARLSIRYYQSGTGP